MSSSDEPPLSDYEQRIIDAIDEHGWFCPYIFDDKSKNPDFAYSVGFTQTLDCPEFIVFGLGQNLMHAILSRVFRQIRDGKRPEDNQRWSDLIEGFDCIARAVHSTNIVRDYFNSAMWFWGDPAERGSELKAFQLVWPSAKTGLFPWDADCAQEVRDLQPPLYLPNRALS
ncbi:MAG: DUF4262 domain-containing protein [Alphaproteobacteria bacterium]